MLKYSVGAAALAAGMVLSACSGGGGGGSVGSAGGSSPGVGSGAGPAPSPTPTPTPTPNTSLLALTSSETFTNDGASASGSFPTNGANPTVTAAATPISVAYDASARSYTVTSGSRSQTFLPADRDAATSTAQLATFKRVSGNKTDTLALTTAGTSGAFTYQYVGAGYWQHTEERADAVSGTMDAFTYGIRTPDAAMPRTGYGNYAIDLLAVRAGNPIAPIESLAGSGGLQVDFAGGQLLWSGSGVTAFPSGGSGPMTFSGSGAITAGSAAFTGTMKIDNASGPLSGRFFGPAAEEIGATFVATAGTIGARTVGSITGRRNAGDATADTTTLASLAAARTFTLPSGGALNLEVQNSRGAAPGIMVNATLTSRPDWTSLAFDPAAKSYTFDGRTFTAANAVAAETSAGMRTYRQTESDKVATLRIYTPDGSNGTLALTYAGFADYTSVLQPATGTTNTAARIWSVFGLETAASDMPKVGTATYAGQVYGAASRIGSQAYDMRGTANWQVDFVARTITGEVAPVFTPSGGGSALDLGPLRLAANIAGSSPNSITGSMIEKGGAGSVGRANLTVDGRFFGPKAAEAGMNMTGYWQLNSSGSSTDTLWINGIAIGKRQ